MKAERGFFLIEALIALLIFTLGILGMIGMGATAVGAQSDARYRSDAATLADEIAGYIQLNADRSTLVNLQASLNSFQHQPGGANCVFNGALSGDPGLLAVLNKVVTVGPGLPGLPGTNAATQQILIDTTPAGFNRVQITICWQTPTDAVPRNHVFVTYVN
jgi:type IV pilus assembly protein PilV